MFEKQLTACSRLAEKSVKYCSSCIAIMSISLCSAIMAFVMVKWLSDKQTSIIPSAWVTKSTPILDAIPVDV